MKAKATPTRHRKAQSSSEDSGREAYTAARNHSRMIARLLIAMRKHTGLSHEEVAARARISPSTVHTHERASIRASFVDSIRIGLALGFDYTTVLHEVERRLDEAGTPFLPDEPAMSERAFVKMRCKNPLNIPAAEVRRQLRLLRSLTLPKHPARRPRKHPASRK